MHSLVGGEEVRVEPFERVVGGGAERHLQVIALADVADVGEMEDLGVVVRGESLALHELPAAASRAATMRRTGAISSPRTARRMRSTPRARSARRGARRRRARRGGEAPRPVRWRGRRRASMRGGDRAAHRDQGELARVEPLADGDEADAFGHLRVDDLVDTGRRVLDPEPERLRDARGDRVSREPGIEIDGTSREPLRVEIPEHDGRVRHRRLAAPARVAGRAGVRAGGPGADPESSRVVDPGDAPAARPDRVHVHHRNPHREFVDHPFAPDEGLGAGDERDVRARSAHVQGDEVVVSGRHPRRWPPITRPPVRTGRGAPGGRGRCRRSRAPRETA